MMQAMMTLNPVAVTIFTLSWTIGMAAMMFPAIIPMVLLYHRLISNGQNNNLNYKFPLDSKLKDNADSMDKNKKCQNFYSHLLSWNAIKASGFVGTYLFVWALTGVVFLVFWSILMNNLFVGYSLKDLAIVSGILLIVSGIYQFTSLKKRCLGYCESPLAFFMKRWKGKKLTNGLKMGMYHGIYCLGCCWPYFLLMIALGWMNILWMGLFAAIIFAEKVWSKGIWIARIAGFVFIVTGLLSITGIISIVTEGGEMSSSGNDMNAMIMKKPSQDGYNKDIKYNMDMDKNQ